MSGRRVLYVALMAWMGDIEWRKWFKKLLVQGLNLGVSFAIAVFILTLLITHATAPIANILTTFGGFNSLATVTAILRLTLKYLKNIQTALLVVLFIGSGVIASATVWMFMSTNSDGQGAPDLPEALSGMNPGEAFIYYKDVPFEEQCAQELRTKGGKFVDEDGDGFAPDCGDSYDNDPSYTPRPLARMTIETDFEPNGQVGAVLAKQRPFSAPVPARGQDPIKDLRLYITADFLGPEDGEDESYKQPCKISYDKRSRVVCTLDGGIDDWRTQFGSGSTPTLQMKWNLKYVTKSDKYGYVREEWIPFNASFK